MHNLARVLTGFLLGLPAVTALVTPARAEEPPLPPEIAEVTGHGQPAAGIEATYFSAFRTLRSSSGKRLRLSIYVSRQSGAKPNVTVGLTHARGGETHSWNFTAGSRAFRMDATGTGRLRLSGAQTGGRGKVRLSFKPDGRFGYDRCGGKVAVKTRPLAVSGVAFFSSGTKAWGRVGKRRGSIRFARATGTWSTGVSCPAPEEKCKAGIKLTWYAADHGDASTYLTGGKYAGDWRLTAARRTTLAKPAGAVRTDVVYVTGLPAPRLLIHVDSSAQLNVKAKTGGLFISAPPSSPQSRPCGGLTETRTSWFGTVTNDPTPLTVKAAVYGSIRMPDGAAAVFTRAATE